MNLTLDVTVIFWNLTQFQNLAYPDRPDRVALLTEHWASIQNVVGSMSIVVRHIFGNHSMFYVREFRKKDLVYQYVHCDRLLSIFT